ncbi:hypothetical protein CEK26_013283 [Fusarium fujikuroi]|nr:hypothetical protein CEK27_013297 [Fusarium fujikuroi]QGJ00215.1 hypothetical protein CEK26_013283 [Fusarium fujikuroi]
MASSSDEGEIVENAAKDLKATSLQHTGGSSVDRQDRNKSRLSTPDHDSASRYSNGSRRSISPRGYKRSHDERDRDRDHYNSRPRDQGYRRNYEDARRDDHRKPRGQYDDLDRPASRTSNFSYGGRDRSRDRDNYRDGDRDRFSNKRPRNRSRSPQRSRPSDRGRFDRFVREGQYDRRDDGPRELKYDDSSRNGGSMSKRTTVGEASRAEGHHAKPEQGLTNGHGTSKASQREPAAQKEPERKPEPEPEPDYEEPEPFDEEAEIERRRKRREEILAKHSSATPLLLHAVGAAASKAHGASPASTAPDTPMRAQSDIESPRTPRSGMSTASGGGILLTRGADIASPRSPGSHTEMSPGGINFLDDRNLMNSHGKAQPDEEDGPSAADYDPTGDMKEDERRHELRHGNVVLHGEQHPIATEQQPQEDIQKESTEKTGGDDDDDDFDMFAEDFDEEKYATKPVEPVAPIEGDGKAPDVPAIKGGILEGDDKDGYYKIRIGEVLNGRYQIQAALGRGMFSGVARAVDITTKELVAIKMMRNNDALRKGGYTEIAILEKLNEADPEGRKHIIKFIRQFDYKGHLCMVFENLSMNLREVLRKFGNNVGINLGATRAYAYQIFVALAHMRKCSIIHADLKPDNILVNESHNVLKICDLGTAIDKTDAATAHMDVTPYLVSRFYRAPEIILGIPYDYAVDMWSIGCTLYEMYTGKILFAGDSNNQMLKAIMEIRGRLTPKLFKRGQLSPAHFDDKGQFVSIERDKVLGKTTVRTLAVVKPTRDLRTRLMAASSGMNDAETRDLNHFIDLLEHCLTLNPDKRMKPADALRHPFFTARTGHDYFVRYQPDNMQQHAIFGYQTPPPSPGFDHPKCTVQQPFAVPHSRHFQNRCVPLAPEARLGRVLEGTLQLTDILGTGAYGVVYLAVDLKTGGKYAVKCLSKFNPDGTPLESRQFAYQQREIRLHWKASEHSNVVQMLKIVNDPDCIYVILEYCPEGDLFLNITERGQYVGKDELSRNIFLQILDAVEHCHNLGIYHRDLKPENILVTDHGDTVKLADFGLATSDDRSEDYGCGSTFYMSPECLDPSARKPYYLCAPNDVWSLGVILVNLTCGRNPWKQASFQDSTYRAYAGSKDFLKTILPLSDELNDILGRIFEPIPEQRITLSELRTRIMACSMFTVPPMSSLPTPPASPNHITEYVSSEDAIIDDYEYDSPLSPASSDDEGSLTSSDSTIDDLDDEFEQERQMPQTPPEFSPHAFDPEEPKEHQLIYHSQEFVPQKYSGPVPVPVAVPPQPMLCQQVPIPVQAQVPVSVQAPCQPKSYFPIWDMVKYVQQVPMLQHHVPFHQQVPFMPTFQGCY